MRRLGNALLWAGAGLGACVSVVMAGLSLNPGLLDFISWWIALGAAKLVLAGSAGLMASGAVALRLERRREERAAQLNAPARDHSKG
jgi:hypothetical protein